MNKSDTNSLNIEQLKELVAKNLNDASGSGFIQKMRTVARELGTLVDRHYTKYEWKSNGVLIWIDDYGHCGYATFKGRRVWQDHNYGFFIPGNWQVVVEDAFCLARNKAEERATEKEREERESLISMLILESGEHADPNLNNKLNEDDSHLSDR